MYALPPKIRIDSDNRNNFLKKKTIDITPVVLIIFLDFSLSAIFMQDYMVEYYLAQILFCSIPAVPPYRVVRDFEHKDTYKLRNSVRYSEQAVLLH